MRSSVDLLYVGSGGGPRRSAFVDAWQSVTGASPACLSYADISAQPERSAAMARAARYIRFDSPDRDGAALDALFVRGCSQAAAAGFATQANHGAGAHLRGAIGATAQLAYGLCAMVREVMQHTVAEASVSPDDLKAGYDKSEAQARFAAAGLPVPRFLGNPDSFEALRKGLPAQPTVRAFLKLRHGSSAAGMMALERRGAHWRALTTAFENTDGVLCATRTLQTLVSEAAIGRLVDALAPYGLHLESWAPKYVLDGLSCDLRVIPCAAEPDIRVRRSNAPMTNLHLGGLRGDSDTLRRRVGEANWAAMCATARRAADAFPALATAGIDLAFLSDPRSHVLFEINAFGSFVKDSADGPCRPYAAEAAVLAAHLAARREAVA